MKALHAGSIETAGRSAFKVASSTALAADALRKTAAATVYRAGKNIVFSQTQGAVDDAPGSQGLLGIGTLGHGGKDNGR